MFLSTSNLGDLCLHLNIPGDKRNDAASAAEYYDQVTLPRKVRSIIFFLDFIGDITLADSIMDYAEPPAGKAPMQLGPMSIDLAI